ncbi:MAG: class I SAM-dependent methyltransferase [Pseudomonadales bacterium]
MSVQQMPDQLNALQQRLTQTLPHARLDVAPLSDCAQIQLALINADFETGPLAPEVMRAVLAAPAYWAFCWGSGLALAQVLLEQPQRVAGLRVLDFGSGSGIAGIAAAMAGAEKVIACDSDADARLATSTNAELNAVSISVIPALSALAEPIDLVLVADVLYDRANLNLLRQLEQLPAQLLIADSRIEDLGEFKYRVIDQRLALTTPNLGEFDEFKTVRLFQR